MNQHSPGSIHVRGARTHNLKNLSVEIPRQALVAVTGVSGSGKSSLAFHTLFAEGQRRFLESLSPYTRQFFHQLEPPDVDAIEGLPPTIALEQQQRKVSPRSTLATITELGDYLRLLYARAGQPHCTSCGEPVGQQSLSAIVRQILNLGDRRKVMILATLVHDRKGSHQQVFETISREGFVRARVDGTILDVQDAPLLEPNQRHTIEAVIDRIVVKEGIEDRLQESLSTAVQLGEGSCLISYESDSGWKDRLFSTQYACPRCELSFPNLSPRLFNFNSPHGACLKCEGLGLINTETEAPLPCPECHGTRLQPYPRNVTLFGITLPQWLAFSVGDAVKLVPQSLNELQQSSSELSEEARQAALHILPQIETRLQFLQDVGLHYLTLDRRGNTLSGGEHQRARLASCLGAGLLGVCYVLDEPTQGLHSIDTARLLESLRQLRDQGNSVIVVEHDPQFLKEIDYLIDIGPGGGSSGGELVAEGWLSELLKQNETFPKSVTLNSLRAPLFNAIPLSSQAASGFLRLTGATLHNLQNVSVDIPLNRLVGIAGVSGSGKSSLIAETLVPAAKAILRTGEQELAHLKSLAGMEQIQRVLEVTQSPIGRSGRSNPATFLGIWDSIRKIFAKTREARIRGYDARRFSFNSKSGQCETCQGRGEQRIELDFLPDVWITCPACRGQRFNRATLAIPYRGKSVADVLAMPCEEAARFFENFQQLAQMLQTLTDMGLGYLALGQPAPTLSGGEAQRLKLARELGTSSNEQTLFVLDEPTSGLHPADVSRLVGTFRKLIVQGHSIVVIEHNLELLARCDQILELGPGGGAFGGQLIWSGQPGEIPQPETPTQRALQKVLGPTKTTTS